MAPTRLNDQPEILLTGATGFLGMELLVRLLEQTGVRVVAPVRAADDEAAQARIDDVLNTLLGPRGAARHRVRAIAADLERPGLGLRPRDERRLASTLGAVVHCAASVQFTLPLQDARRINVEGTRTMLELAATAPYLDRFVHVSTAFVAGDRPGRCFEHEGDVGQPPRNTYEQTKLEAEAVVAASGLPAAILRPSIVVGDSVTGWTPAFNVIYWPLQAFSRGLLPVVPGDPDGRVDIVPVDVVANALLELAVGPRRTGTFHAVAGEDAPTARELSRLAAAHFGTEPPRFVPVGAAPEVEDRAGAFLPYFRVRGTFDVCHGREIGIRAPLLHDYFPALMRYAGQARWGRAARPRWDVAAAAAA